ncbi:peptidoglycan-binding domain-containing protein [Streptomyces sp. ODS05-4]|uniref:peptidoglycan-binding domain-containing protein n=1 Tax=Streptomyces sp. ODS05-4 TaxID=2944939 RepID=UPI002109B6B3|nr:peptidoglycan-binding domain-containing protein [Streptomyces sp. ODS05-4]
MSDCRCGDEGGGVRPGTPMPLYVRLDPELVPLRDADGAPGPRHRRRTAPRAARRRYAVAGAVCAVVAAAGVAGWAGGLFGGGPSDGVRGDQARRTAPAWPEPLGPASPDGSSSPAAPSSAPASASPSPSSASPSPSAPTSGPASPSRSASPSASSGPPASDGPAEPSKDPAGDHPASAGPGDQASPGQGGGSGGRPGGDPSRSRGPQPPPPQEGPTLERGSEGTEVFELQWRLRLAGLYDGPMDGRFGRDVQWGVSTYQRARDLRDDGRGVYGPQTRRALEAETGGSR